MGVPTERVDHVALVTLDNPPVNAAAMDMLEDVIAAFDTFNDRDYVRCVVLTGAENASARGGPSNRPI